MSGEGNKVLRRGRQSGGEGGGCRCGRSLWTARGSLLVGRLKGEKITHHCISLFEYLIVSLS